MTLGRRQALLLARPGACRRRSRHAPPLLETTTQKLSAARRSGQRRGMHRAGELLTGTHGKLRRAVVKPGLQARQAQKARVALHPAHQDTRAPLAEVLIVAKRRLPGMSETRALAVERMPAVDQVLEMQRLAPQTSWRACSLQAASMNPSPEPHSEILHCDPDMQMAHEHQCVVKAMLWCNLSAVAQMCACPMATDMHRTRGWIIIPCLAAGKDQPCSGKSTLHLRCMAAIPPPGPKAPNPTLQCLGILKLRACRPAAARQETD